MTGGISALVFFDRMQQIMWAPTANTFENLPLEEPSTTKRACRRWRNLGEGSRFMMKQLDSENG